MTNERRRPRIDLEVELITRTVMLTPAEMREVGRGGRWNWSRISI